MHISLLYGTETGNTEILCDDLSDALGDTYEIEINNLQDIDPKDLNRAHFHIIVCSTYGEGELPQSALPFMDKLIDEKPDLTGVVFSMFGFGDTAYDETYNNGSRVLADALIERGATMVGPRGLHDASGLDDAQEIALPWAKERILEAASVLS